MTSRAIVRLSLLSHLTLFIAAVLCCTDRTLADTYRRVTGVDVIEYVFRLTLSDDTDMDCS